MTDTITLVASFVVLDTYGNEVAIEKEKVIYCEVDSISQSEFYAAANTELNPQYRFRVFFGDYEGQTVVIYRGKRYSIYRTYQNGDSLELYAERKLGV